MGSDFSEGGDAISGADSLYHDRSIKARLIAIATWATGALGAAFNFVYNPVGLVLNIVEARSIDGAAVVEGACEGLVERGVRARNGGRRGMPMH